MIIGQTIHGDSEASRIYLTPWVLRRADRAKFAYERIHTTLSSAEAFAVLHKDAEDAGSGTVATGGTFSQISSSGIFEASPTDLKEMVRFRLTISPASGWLHFRILPPTWFFEAKV